MYCAHKCNQCDLFVLSLMKQNSTSKKVLVNCKIACPAATAARSRLIVQEEEAGEQANIEEK